MSDIQFLAHMDSSPKGPLPHFVVGRARYGTDAVMALAHQFGLGGNVDRGTLTQDAATLTYTEGSLRVTLYRASGGVRFHDMHRWQVDDGVANIQIEDADAVAVARGFVKKFGLAPENEFRVLKVTRLKVGKIALRGDKREERTIDVGVAFQRLLHGIPVEGRGGKLIVYFDGEKRLTGVDRIWRGIGKTTRPGPLRPPEYAEKDLVRRWGKSGPGSSGRIEVGQPRFGYFEKGWNDVQEVIEPAYFFPLTLISPSDERIKMKSLHITAASTKPHAVLMPPAQKPKKLRPRVIS